jgi:hypothetical protein
MKRLTFAALLLACLGIWKQSAIAHHSTAGYFDTRTGITISGTITKTAWINPHVLLYVDGKNEKNQPEKWVIQGFGLAVAVRNGVTQQRFPHGTHITARAYPARLNLALSESEAVLQNPTAGKDQIVEGGDLRFDSGEVLTFGRGPNF